MRRRHLIVPFVAVCLVAVACSRLERAIGAGNAATQAPPNPATAILVSVSGGSISMVDPQTGASKVLVANLTNFQAGYATWAPDHLRLVYGDGQIVSLDAVSGASTTLRQGTSLSMPAWSPDGSTLVFGDGTSMRTVDPGVANARTHVLTLPGTLAPFAFDWTPGPSIAFQGLQLDCNSPTGCYSTDRSDIYTIRPDGSGLRRITKTGHAADPRWSPNAQRILFVRIQTRGKRTWSSLWTVNADGTAAAQMLPLRNVVAADWSPDGTQVAILRTAPNQFLQLWIANADGTGLHAIGQPFPGTEGTVDW